MQSTVLNTVIVFVVNGLLSGLLGYFINIIKNYKKCEVERVENEKIQNEALKTLLQAQLTNIYFVYNEIGKIPDYMMKNWNNLFNIYRNLGGNDYVDMLKHKMEKWEIIRTDILK